MLWLPILGCVSLKHNNYNVLVLSLTIGVSTMTSERHRDVISILPSYAPGAGTFVPPRAHLTDDCGVLSLDGMWSFAYHRTDPAPFVNVEQPWDEPAPADDASEIDVPMSSEAARARARMVLGSAGISARLPTATVAASAGRTGATLRRR